MSLGKILHLEERLSLKSFIYIKEKRGPGTKPCGTPDFIGFDHTLSKGGNNFRGKYLQNVR